MKALEWYYLINLIRLIWFTYYFILIGWKLYYYTLSYFKYEFRLRGIFLVATSFYVLVMKNEKKWRKKRSVWIKEWLKRTSLGINNSLVEKLRLVNPSEYKKNLRKIISPKILRILEVILIKKTLLCGKKNFQI